MEKTLMLGKIEGKRRRGWQRMRWLDSILNSMDMNLSKLRETVEDRGVWQAAVHGVAKSWTWLSDSTTTKLSLDIMEVYFTSVWLKWSSLIYIRRMSWLKYLLILQSSSFMLFFMLRGLCLLLFELCFTCFIFSINFSTDMVFFLPCGRNFARLQAQK